MNAKIINAPIKTNVNCYVEWIERFCISKIINNEKNGRELLNVGCNKIAIWKIDPSNNKTMLYICVFWLNKIIPQEDGIEKTEVRFYIDECCSIEGPVDNANALQNKLKSIQKCFIVKESNDNTDYDEKDYCDASDADITLVDKYMLQDNVRYLIFRNFQNNKKQIKWSPSNAKKFCLPSELYALRLNMSIGGGDVRDSVSEIKKKKQIIKKEDIKNHEIYNGAGLKWSEFVDGFAGENIALDVRPDGFKRVYLLLGGEADSNLKPVAYIHMQDQGIKISKIGETSKVDHLLPAPEVVAKTSGVVKVDAPKGAKDKSGEVNVLDHLFEIQQKNKETEDVARYNGKFNEAQTLTMSVVREVIKKLISKILPNSESTQIEKYEEWISKKHKGGEYIYKNLKDDWDKHNKKEKIEKGEEELWDWGNIRVFIDNVKSGNKNEKELKELVTCIDDVRTARNKSSHGNTSSEISTEPISKMIKIVNFFAPDSVSAASVLGRLQTLQNEIQNLASGSLKEKGTNTIIDDSSYKEPARLNEKSPKVKFCYICGSSFEEDCDDYICCPMCGSEICEA